MWNEVFLFTHSCYYFLTDCINMKAPCLFLPRSRHFSHLLVVGSSCSPILHFHFPCFFLPSPVSFLQPLYYRLSISQHLVRTPFAPCNFLLNRIILLSFSHSSHTPIQLSGMPLHLALSVLESHISAIRKIKFLLLPQLLDTEPVLISCLKTHIGAETYSALVGIWAWSFC